MSAEEAWIIRAEWSNSSPTYYGPFQYADDAQAFAEARLLNDEACIDYELAILSPVGAVSA